MSSLDAFAKLRTEQLRHGLTATYYRRADARPRATFPDDETLQQASDAADARWPSGRAPGITDADIEDVRRRFPEHAPISRAKAAMFLDWEREQQAVKDA